MQTQQAQNRIPTNDIINSIKYMGSDDIERLKNSLIERDIYFKAHKKDNIDSVIKDFKNHNYNDSFLNDLEQGLKKSSIYED
jgi:phosphopantothenate synthetase